MKIGCWASDLGGCDTKLSAEHIVSASLWTGPTVTASGGPFGDAREIGVASLTAKILCKRHNSALSELDVAGSNAFSALTAGIALSNARGRIAQHSWFRHGFSIDGPRLERWFIKTAINIAIMLKGTPAWALDGAVGRPSLALVETVFGLSAASRPLGLYAAAAPGDGIDSKEEVRCHLLFDNNDAIAGASFVFRGFNFLVNLTRVEVLGILGGPDKRVLRSQKDLLYHIGRINSDVGAYRSHFVDFNWPESSVDHFAP